MEVERTGENFLVFFQDGWEFFDVFRTEFFREKLDGRQIFVRKTGRATNFCPKNWTGDKFLFEKLDGRQKKFGGRATPNYLYGHGCMFARYYKLCQDGTFSKESQLDPINQERFHDFVQTVKEKVGNRYPTRRVEIIPVLESPYQDGEPHTDIFSFVNIFDPSALDWKDFWSNACHRILSQTNSTKIDESAIYVFINTGNLLPRSTFLFLTKNSMIFTKHFDSSIIRYKMDRE